MKKTTLRQAALKLAIVAFVLLSPLGLRAQTLFSEDFEGGSMPTGWTTDGNGTWSVATGDYSSSTGAGNGTYNAKITHGSTGNATKLITPEIDLSGATSAVLSYMHVQRSWGGDIDELRVYYRASSSDSWTLLDGQEYTNAVASWTTEEDIVLPNLSSTYQIAFEFTDRWGYGVGIDNIVITTGASCPKPTNLTYNATDELATLSWTSDAESWNLKYKVADDADYTEETGLTTTSYEISVAPQTTYQWMVQAVCSGTPGDYTNPASFTTPCAGITTFPWTETFNSLTAGIPNCWNNSEGTTTTESYKWNYYATGHDGAGLRFDSYYNNGGNTNILKTPLMNFPASQVMQLVFWYKNPTGGDFSVYISTDGGATYTTALATGLTSQSTWKEKEINLTDYVGAENVVIVFKGTSNYGSGDAYIYLDDVTVRQAPSCLAPTGLAATPSTTSAELSWTANSGEAAWTLYWKKTTDENYTEVANATNPYTLNGLTAATNYQYYVVANCAADDASEPSAVFPFTTACDVISALGYSENFDTYTAGNNVLPSCWNHINTTTNSTYAAFPRVYSTNANSSPNCLYFYSYSYPSSISYYDPQPQYAILPEMSDLAGKFVTLQARGSNSSSTYKIGTMSDPTDASTFTQIAEQALTTSYQEFEHIIPTDAPGNYLAIMMDAASGYNNTTRGVYIDDIQITEVPTCRKPSALMLDNSSAITAHTATLKWTNGEEGQTAWQIAYSTDANFDPNSVTPIDVTTKPATLEGLAQSTTYYAYVRANCGDEDGVSAWCNTKATFSTLAGNNILTGLAVPDITVSSSSAIATWNANAANDLHQLYELYLSTDGTTAPTAETEPTHTSNEASYTFTGLTPETQYFVWVRDNCGTDGYSAWVGSVSFTTQLSCPTPVLNADGITNITAHTADVEWSNFTENTNYEVSYRTAAYFNGVTEEFGTAMPTDWTRLAGLLNEDGTATLTSDNGWFFGTANGVFDNHARVNIYSNNQRWLVTPALTVPENGALTFDMALTAYSGTLAAPQTTGTDDKFVVLITTDEMATWTVLRQWDNAGSEYVYNNIPCSATGENVMIGLGGYVGQTVRIAFYGESTSSNADNNLHIDNVGVGVAVPAGEWQTQNVTENSLQLTNLEAETSYDVKVAGYCDETVGGESNIQTFTTAIACPVPTGLAIVGDATTNSVDLTWTAGAANQDAWQICLNGDETNLLDVTDATVTGTTVTYTLTGLTSGADYSVKVRANCGDVDGVSLQWSNTANFTTEASCTVPTAFAVVENSVEAHQAQLSWTAGGEETAWDIYYSTTATEAPVNGFTPPTVGAIADNPYTLDGLDAATTYYVWMRAHCGDAAGQQSLWVGPVSFTTECETPVVDAYNPFFEGFEGTTFPPICWSVGDPSSHNSNWQRNTDQSYVNTGSACAYSYFYGPIYLYTPILHINGTTATLSFSSYNAYPEDYDKNSVLVSVNGGAWTELWSPESVSASWVVTTIDMTDYVGQDIQLCFKYEGDYAHGWLIDDVNLYVPTVIEKAIEANKWYAISTPVHTNGNNEALSSVTNLTTGTYDLYGYTESAGTWNAPTNSLTIGKGYIYRRSTNATLQFVGIANTGNVDVNLTASCSDNDLKGFNLVGNPYPYEANPDMDCYKLMPAGTWKVKASNENVDVCEAVLVYTDGSNATVSFSAPTSSSDHAALAFTVSNDEFEDVAYARFDNGEGLPKIGHLAANAPMLSIPVEGRRYAIANLGSDCQSFDMVFRGTGTYTLSFNGNTGYCHLIDRVAGKDIDMLRQPSYTFSSNGFDADRFMVKLSPDAQENANGNFAYWNGNVWMVEGNGTLQVFDALGRQLFSQEISNSNFEIQNSLFPAAGVYVLRMGEKTQKIVVR